MLTEAAVFYPRLEINEIMSNVIIKTILILSIVKKVYRHI